MISDNIIYYGTAITILIDAVDRGVCVRNMPLYKSGFYIINEKVPILLKYSSNRISPWTYFIRSDDIQHYCDLTEKYGDCIICFICGFDGTAALRKNELIEIINLDDKLHQKSVRIVRKHNEMYTISASDGRMHRKISRKSLLERVEALL